jgi:hypothetical protein
MCLSIIRPFYGQLKREKKKGEYEEYKAEGGEATTFVAEGHQFNGDVIECKGR